MSDDTFDHIPTKTAWKIVATVTIGAMTDRVAYVVILDGLADHPDPERLIDRATGGRATRIRLESMTRLGSGVVIDFDDGFTIVDAGGGA